MTKETAKKNEEIKKDAEKKKQNSSKEGAIKAEKKKSEEGSEKKKKSKKAKKINELEEQIIKNAELNDKYLRLFSEFDNFRKRSIKERLELTKTASEDIILSMLQILDDFERAIIANEENSEAEHLNEGLKLIYNKFKSVLFAKGLEVIETKGQEFDTDYHEALTQIPAPTDDLKGKVVDEVEKGYLLNGKIIRFAKVVVGK